MTMADLLSTSRSLIWVFFPQLFDDELPDTTSNFRFLCTGKAVDLLRVKYSACGAADELCLKTMELMVR